MKLAFLLTYPHILVFLQTADGSVRVHGIALR